MATNNPYSRTYKSKREQYEEKLKQRNENEEWIFGNNFGRPGAGAPLRDKKGNVVSHLKSVANNNLDKFEAQYFSKGDNNISVVNNKIYERNNGDINNVISDPFNPFRNYINQFEQKNNANINNANNNNTNFNNATINNVNLQNLNNNINPNIDYLQNQIQINPNQLNNLNNINNINQLNNVNNLNILNNQINNEEQKKEIYLNQFKQNPYLVQVPYGIVTQYPMIHPTLPVYTQNPNLNQLNTNNNLLMNNNSQIEYQRPYSSLSENINNKNINNNINNNVSNNISNNINNISNNNYGYSDITGNNGRTRKYIRKLPESTLFSDIDPEKIKLDKEKKMDEWKKELLVQINEKKKREADEKRRMKEREKKEELNNEKYNKMKKKQKEEQQKNHMKRLNKQMQNEVDGSGSLANILDSSNDLEQANKSIHSQNNMILKDNDFSQNNIQIQENINNTNYNNNFYSNNLNQNDFQNQEEDNFKSYIDRQYHLLNDTLNNDINNEMKRITEEVENNYTSFTKKFLLLNTQSKTTAELSLENEKKLKKIQDLIEEKKLVDYILGQRERPPTPQKEDEVPEKEVELPVPSYFGINRDKAENKYLGLHSKSSFISKNEGIANFIASGRNQNIDNNINEIGKDLNEKENINNKYNQIMNDELDINYNYNVKDNTGKSTFGTNIHNDEALGGSINLAKNLDNISTFIPLNKNRENINFTNEQKMKFIPGLNDNLGKYQDKDMEDLFKDLDKIYELTNKIDVTSKARNISDKFENDLNRLNNLNKNQNVTNDILSRNNNLNINQEKISEENSNISNSNYNKNLTNSKLSEKNRTNSKLSEKNRTNSKLSENNKTNEKLSENNKTNEKLSENKSYTNSNKNDEYKNLNLEDSNENVNNNELNSNQEKVSSSQNGKEENELSNSQNFNEQPNNNENINNNDNNNINNNLNNIEQNNNELQNDENNNNNLNNQNNNEPQNEENNHLNENQNNNNNNEEEEYEEEEEEENEQ